VSRTTGLHQQSSDAEMHVPSLIKPVSLRVRLVD
jgi:hypothetical protein